MAMSIVFGIMVAMQGLGIVFTIAMIGKPRTTTTPGAAITGLIVGLAWIAALTWMYAS